ncbi:MAG: DUF2157 domain-containing protein [Parvibaculum sp.]
MLGNLYAKRVTRDLDTWVANGWITKDNALAIRTSLDGEDDASRLPAIISILGGVLIAFAAMAFVAANWQEMSKATRLGLLGLTMWGTYGAALWAHLKGKTALAETALLIASGLFGASIMLIGQMYHMPSDFSSGLLAWGVGTIVTALAIKSRAALGASQLIFAGFLMNGLTGSALQISYLVPRLATTYLAFRQNWAPLKHLSLIGLLMWIFGNALVIGDISSVSPTEIIGCLAALLAFGWIFAAYLESKGSSFARSTQNYLAFCLFVLIWLPQVAEEQASATALLGALLATMPLLAGATYWLSRRVEHLHAVDALAFSAFPAVPLIQTAMLYTTDTSDMWLLAPLYLAMTVWLIAYGSRAFNRFLVNLGFAAFAAEVLFLYFETFGTLLDTSAFFLVGGVLLIAGGLLLERMRRRTLPGKPVEDGQ